MRKLTDLEQRGNFRQTALKDATSDVLQSVLDSQQATSGTGQQTPIGTRIELPAGVITLAKPLIVSTGCSVLGQGMSTIVNGDMLIGCRQGHGYTTNVEIGQMQLNGSVTMDASASSESQSLRFHDINLRSIDLGTTTRYRLTLERLTFVPDTNGQPFSRVPFRGNARISNWLDVRVAGKNATGQSLVQLVGDQCMVNLIGCWFEPDGGPALLLVQGNHSQVNEMGNWWEMHNFKVGDPQAIYDGDGTHLTGRVADPFLGGEAYYPIVFRHGAYRMSQIKQ